MPSRDRALRGERVVPGIEMLYREDDGREIWTRVRAEPLFNVDGSVRKWVGMNVDAGTGMTGGTPAPVVAKSMQPDGS